MTNESPLSILVILGTGRERRLTESAAKFVYGVAKSVPTVLADFVDIRDYNVRFTDKDAGHAEVKKWKSRAAAADGFVIVAPEYNHGYPGELKMLLDAAYDEYARKPVAVAGVSDGGMGGVRMVENLKPVLVEFQMVVIAASVYFSKVDELFGVGGEIRDPMYEGRVRDMLTELLWWARALKNARDAS